MNQSKHTVNRVVGFVLSAVAYILIEISVCKGEDFFCNPAKCRLPDCLCASTKIPKKLSLSETPMMVSFTFSDAVNHQVSESLMHLFRPSRKNPNGAPISMTLFVSHRFTNHSQVAEFYLAGHESVDLTCGVLQGSPLGPLLFIIYINDLVNSLRGDHVFCNMYADDTVIVSSGNDVNEACIGSEATLRKVGEWCDKNKIALNVKKSKHLISGPRMFLKESDNIIVYKNLQLGNVDCYTYLGIKIDKCLNFEKQLDATIAKVNGRLVTFAKTRRFMDKSTSSLVYKQTIMPYFDYISLLTESSTQRKIGKLQPLQNRAVKIVCLINNYVSTEEMRNLHNELGLMLLRNRRKVNMLKLVFKYSKSIENVETRRPDVVLRDRHKVKMKLPYSNKDRVLKSPYYISVNLWNQLDSDVQNIVSKGEFKKRIRALDLDELKIRNIRL